MAQYVFPPDLDFNILNSDFETLEYRASLSNVIKWTFLFPYPKEFKTSGIVLEIISLKVDPIEPDLSTIIIKSGGSRFGIFTSSL